MDLMAVTFDKEVESLRSPHCDQKAKVRFKNCTNKVVDLLWINFEGKETRYILLRPNQFIDMHTYINHYWIARNVHTGDPMIITKQPIFSFSEFLRKYRPDFPSSQIPLDRWFVFAIILPIYSLKYRCMLALRDSIGSERNIEELEIPNTLKEDIKKLIERKKMKGFKRMS